MNTNNDNILSHTGITKADLDNAVAPINQDALFRSVTVAAGITLLAGSAASTTATTTSAATNTVVSSAGKAAAIKLAIVQSSLATKSAVAALVIGGAAATTYIQTPPAIQDNVTVDERLPDTMVKAPETVTPIIEAPNEVLETDDADRGQANNGQANNGQTNNVPEKANEKAGSKQVHVRDHARDNVRDNINTNSIKPKTQVNEVVLLQNADVLLRKNAYVEAANAYLSALQKFPNGHLSDEARLGFIRATCAQSSFTELNDKRQLQIQSHIQSIQSASIRRRAQNIVEAAK